MLRFAPVFQTLGFFLFGLIFTSVIGAAAAELNLTGDQFWVVLASRQDIDQAIAVARTNHSLKAIVVRSANGWFASIVGPHAVTPGSGRQFLDELTKSQGIPKDAYLTKGAKFIAVIWTPPASPILDTMQYDGEHEAILRKGVLEIKLSKRLIGDGQSAPVANALYKGKPAFRIELTDNPAEKPESQVALARLDPNSSMPQVVFTYFWQGAHCCTVTKIATLNNEGKWHVIDGGALDGDGYDFEDLDNAGFGYLVSVDQNFLYAFDSYAGSLAPNRIHQLVGDKLVDVTSDPKFQHRLLQSLYSEEDMAAQGDDVWHSNGFLAGWVASSMLVGKGRDAWSKMLSNYDHGSDFGPEKCAIGVSVDNCPDNKRVKVAFPAALKQFLVEHGYIADQSLYPVPYDVEPSVPSPIVNPVGTPSQLQTCADVSETLKKLIYQVFLGREVRGGETYDTVSLRNDTTLEAYDSSIQTITCAVTYDLPLKPLIGHLAEEGELARAGVVSKLSRRSGGIVSNRVKFVVKPTATPGQQFIELLP